MNIQKFIKIFAEDIVMVEVDNIKPETILDELEDWDSLAIISLNAILDENYSFTLNVQEIKSLNIFGDILSFIDQKTSK
ncbi:hypothetical protein [Cytobacillus praedii]|uniref:hypothetical protein n=1 Tax=Cytobacillus praedii TaxID=1742358 RepID=UPI003AF99E55